MPRSRSSLQVDTAALRTLHAAIRASIAATKAQSVACARAAAAMESVLENDPKISALIEKVFDGTAEDRDLRRLRRAWRANMSACLTIKTAFEEAARVQIAALEIGGTHGA